MRLPLRLAALLSFCIPLLTPAAVAAQGAVVTTPQVRAELVAHAPDGVAPGKPVQLALRIEHQPHWHTYWKNPGDSGLPTNLTWTLPGGVQAGDVQWPTPKKLPLGPLVNFGYEDVLLLPVALQLPADFKAPTVDVKLAAEWLVCKDVCIPESGEFALSLPTGAPAVAHADDFANLRDTLPVAVPGAQGRAEVRSDARGQTLVVSVDGLPTAWQGREVAFFPETVGVILNAAKPVERWEGGRWTAEVPLDPQRSDSPELIPAVLVARGDLAGAQVAVAVAGPWPAVGAAPTSPHVEAAANVSPVAPPESSPLGLPLAIAFAVVGGLLLNLMPCVFPVLSLKVLGFTHHAHDRGRLLAGGLAYTAGVVLSFVALAALLIALRAGGEQLGWGFQLQSPPVVAVLAALFTLIGLNLLGVFEVGSMLPDRVATAQARHPLVDSALTGVLAVAVAAPCTAPFMGASLGFALTLPAVQALVVFAALGLGMALPYLAASAFPAVARLLPRPGAWMATFKTLMAFPMFGTVVWLVWVLGHQTGIDGAAALLGTLVALAFLAWALGSPANSARVKRVWGTVGVLLLGLTLAWAGPALRQEAVAANATGTVADGWEAWSPERVAEAHAQGQAVFVDFTAAWCVTCQYNKRTTLADAAVKAAFAAKGVRLMRADWTRRDATITAELTRLGRSGVPVYALYRPGNPAPQLLSEILSVGEVTGALATL
ncbi:MAG: thioredoxin family protein [Burkholderiaceae bacterium]|nr:thioredoxin family protein [Burkholderiaceae bacterium]